MPETQILLTFTDYDTAATWQANANLPPATKTDWVAAIPHPWYEHEYQMATVAIVPNVVEMITDSLADADQTGPVRWPARPPQFWPFRDQAALLQRAVTEWEHLGPNGVSEAAAVQAWRQGQLQPLGNINDALNAERPVAPCACPECEQHDPADCDGHCCQDPDPDPDCGCRRRRTTPPDFILETVGDYCIAWPATHHANLVLSQAMPEFIHHADDRLITATSPDRLAAFLSGLDAVAHIATEP